MSYVLDLFEKYAELKVLRFLLSNARGFHLKEIARKTSTSPGTVSKLLSGLLKDGLAKKSVVGNAHVFRLDAENPVVKSFKVLNNLLLLQKQKLVEKILEIDPSSYTIAIYGSFASGLNDEKSDLDLLVITDSKASFDSVARHLERQSGIPVSIEVFSVLDWKKCKEKNKPFYDSVKATNIVLHGSGLF